MPIDPAPLGSECRAIIITEALRSIDADIPDHAVDLDALRLVLETEIEKGSLPHLTSREVVRRWALWRVRKAANKEAARR